MTDLQSRLQTALGTNYRIERELGGGGMSHVFLAEEVELARKVVVKVLPPDMAAGLNAERFRREIQLAASLQHPHIVPLIASGREGDLVWYTMPFIEGESLRARLARERELPIPDAVRILRDVTDALSYAHQHGVVHRDIKPDNVLLTGRHAVVTDFGVAKAVSASTGESSLTSVGIALGTPAYMSPEQASADPHTDHRADIYSLGAMAYEMLTGRPPFTGTPQMVLAAQVTQAPEPVTQRRTTVPPALATLITRALEKKPADRWQTAAELHEQFELMATPSGGATPTMATRAVEARPSARRAAWAIGGLVIAAVAVTAIVKMKGPSSSGSPGLDPHVVAVLPFRVAGADPTLQYLRQGMLDLLQAKLTGEGGPRAADARSVLAAFRDAGGTDQNDVGQTALVTVAQKVGAGRVIEGSVVGPPDHVVLSATLLEMPGGKSLAGTTVEGPKDSLFVMVDRLAAQLLALNAGATTQQLSSLTTTNLDALRAYLDGVVAYRRGRFVTATPLLTHAVQLDSTFALALSQLVEANGWHATTIDMNRVRRLAWQYRDRLNTRDQLILSIRLGSRFPRETPWTEQITDRERATQQMADNPEAWYYLGDGLFHYGNIADIRGAMARSHEAFSHAFQLDSLYGGPVQHLIFTSIVAGDTAATALFVRRYILLDTGDVGGMRTYQWMLASMRKDAATLRSLLAGIDSSGLMARYLGQYLPYDSTVIANWDRISNAEIHLAVLPVDRRTALRRRVRLLWNAGRPAEAHRWLDSLRASGESAAGLSTAATLETLLFGADTVSVDAAVRLLPDTAAGLFVAEVWRLFRGDAGSVDKTVAAFRKAATASSDEEPLRAAAVLDAWGAIRRSAPRPTTERLLAIADSSIKGVQSRNETWSLILGRLYEEAGLFDRALVAIRRRSNSLGFPSNTGLAEALRLEGRIAAKAGDHDGAVLAYQRYLLMRHDPEPSKKLQRDSVVAELAALTGKH